VKNRLTLVALGCNRTPKHKFYKELRIQTTEDHSLSGKKKHLQVQPIKKLIKQLTRHVEFAMKKEGFLFSNHIKT
jgi:hypothetical protein